MRFYISHSVNPYLMAGIMVAGLLFFVIASFIIFKKGERSGGALLLASVITIVGGIVLYSYDSRSEIAMNIVLLGMAVLPIGVIVSFVETRPIVRDKPTKL